MSWGEGTRVRGRPDPRPSPRSGCFPAAHLEEGGVGVGGQVGELQVALDHLAALVEVPQGLVVALGAGGTQQFHVGAGADCGDSEGSAGPRPLLSPAGHRAPAPAGNAADPAAAVYLRGCSRQLPMGFLDRGSPGSHPGTRQSCSRSGTGPRSRDNGDRRRPVPAVGVGDCWGLGRDPRSRGAGAGAAGRNALPTPPGRPRRDKTRLLSGDGCGARPAPLWGAAGRASIPAASRRGGGRGSPPWVPGPGRVSHGRGWHRAPAARSRLEPPFQVGRVWGAAVTQGWRARPSPGAPAAPGAPTPLRREPPRQTPAPLRHRPRR